ncbi:MAG: cysteine desulfurase NifS [Methanobacteriaceae archaeon]|nr:cysteine desulfurase NifS [Methanobacteriaceae archaeon]
MYMDNSATSPTLEEIFKEMQPYYEKKFGNASTLYKMGLEAKKAIEKSRKQVANLINAEPQEIIFTSGGTESDNWAIKGIALKELKKATSENKRNHIITSQIEHPAVLESCKFLETLGFEITYLPVYTNGIIKIEDLEKAIKKETILITIMNSNNEIGTIQPTKEIGKIANKYNITFHSDAVQSIGKIPVDVKKDNIDLLSISSHKIYGPKGIGALFIKKGTKLEKFMHGGGQENGKRSGTENIPAIVGFGKACEIAKRDLKQNMEHNQEIRDQLTKKILTRIPESFVNGDLVKRLPNNIHFRFSGIEGEALILRLEEKGLCAATGSACSSEKLEASHVLTALGIDPALAHGSLRLSIGIENSIDEVDEIVNDIDEVVKTLRNMSPLWDSINNEYIELDESVFTE